MNIKKLFKKIVIGVVIFVILLLDPLLIPIGKTFVFEYYEKQFYTYYKGVVKEYDYANFKEVMTKESVIESNKKMKKIVDKLYKIRDAKYKYKFDDVYNLQANLDDYINNVSMDIDEDILTSKNKSFDKDINKFYAIIRTNSYLESIN